VNIQPEEWRSRLSEKNSLRKFGEVLSPAVEIGGDPPSDEPPEPVDDIEKERIRMGSRD